MQYTVLLEICSSLHINKKSKKPKKFYFSYGLTPGFLSTSGRGTQVVHIIKHGFAGYIPSFKKIYDRFDNIVIV